MVKNKHLILGIHIQNRAKDAVKVQQLLSEYGCSIKTRLGLHEVDENSCSTGGVLLLELAGDAVKCSELEKKLQGMDGIEVKKMVFAHK